MSNWSGHRLLKCPICNKHTRHFFLGHLRSEHGIVIVNRDKNGDEEIYRCLCGYQVPLGNLNKMYDHIQNGSKKHDLLFLMAATG